MKHIAIIAAITCASPAVAEPMQCAPIDQAYTALSEKYGERRIVTGYDAAGNSIEFWLNPNGKSWSVLVVSGGQACLSATGEDWTFDMPKDGDPT